MDELDLKIIAILQSDGRASNARIARDPGVSEGTVRRRLKRLIDEEYISVVAMLDPKKMGFTAEALIGVKADPNMIDQIAADIAELNDVSWVAVTTGSYDIFAWATLASSETLGTFLRTKIGMIPGVRRTETFVNLAAKKRGYGAPF